MSFSAFKKKPQKHKKSTSAPINESSEIQMFDQHPTTFRERLFFNGGEGLSNILIWVNLFASTWLVSGFVFKDILLFSQIFVPLMSLFLLAKNKEQIENSLRGGIFLVSIPIKAMTSLIYVAYFHNQYSRGDLSALLLIAMFSLILQNYLISKVVRNTIFKVITFGFLTLLLTTSLSLLGLFSQTEEPLAKSDLVYLVLGLMPGFVLMSRQFLIDSPVLQKNGWVFENTTLIKNQEKVRPGGISRIVIGSLVLGAAIPSLLLPFNILPQSLFIVVLSFYFVPNLAILIQKEKGQLDERVLKVTLFAALVTLLTYFGAFLSRFGLF